jgi:hypothetical protein
VLLEAVRVLFEAVRVCRGSECLETCSTGPKAWSVVEERGLQKEILWAG